jgi:DNA invertase Pin-like site-specific DNA recombinase
MSGVRHETITHSDVALRSRYASSGRTRRNRRYVVCAVQAGGAAVTTNRAVCYARVSTSHGQDPELQLRELREYIAARGWRAAGEYIDTGVSGAKESRPELNRLMADAHRRKFDVVLVWKLDRFGRSLRHLVNALAELEARGIAFVSLRDNLDLTTPSGRLMFQIIGAMAEFERSLIQERVRAGLRNARAKGKRLGRPPAAVDADEVQRLRSQGLSWRAVAGKLGVGLGTAVRSAGPRSKIQCGADVRPYPITTKNNPAAMIAMQSGPNLS